MAKYKIKKSYLDLVEKDNYDGLGSPSKHGRLVSGEVMEIADVPPKILPHLEEIKEKKTKKGDK